MTEEADKKIVEKVLKEWLSNKVISILEIIEAKEIIELAVAEARKETIEEIKEGLEKLEMIDVRNEEWYEFWKNLKKGEVRRCVSSAD